MKQPEAKQNKSRQICMCTFYVKKIRPFTYPFPKGSYPIVKYLGITLDKRLT